MLGFCYLRRCLIGIGVSEGGVLPVGASVCPEAERCLERALSCLRRGLVVSAWGHVERAGRALDKWTDAPGTEKAEERP